MSDIQERKGSCLCGAVHYRITGPARAILACHCTQCRKQTGHHFAATAAKVADVNIEGADHVTWYAASDEARRGFCHICGSTLFWQRNDSDHISIGAGTLDGETGLKLERHVFADDKGDYYEITDGKPQHESFSRPPSSNI